MYKLGLIKSSFSIINQILTFSTFLIRNGKQIKQYLQIIEMCNNFSQMSLNDYKNNLLLHMCQ